MVGMLPGTHFVCWRAVLLSHFPESPNFLNSSPTSKEGALRLLSALSGRFWQQTAICPISLWALVVELKWARAQAARRISSYLKSSVFFWTPGDSGKFDKRTARLHRECVLESIPTMEETDLSDEQLVHVLISARRLMLIAKWDKWQFVVKTCR